MQTRPDDLLRTPLPTTDNAEPGTLPPTSQTPDAGYFNVFRVEDLMRGYHAKPPMSFDRRAFYKISLLSGHSRVDYADQTLTITDKALWFATSHVPYRWLPQDEHQTGYYCLFTEAFLLPDRSRALLDELPIFQPGNNPVLILSDVDYALMDSIFQKMMIEITSDYAYKYDLLRAYLWELIHVGQKRQPLPVHVPARTASMRVVASFSALLERQFPIATPQQQLRLRTAKDAADQLAVHVNHLNRVLKEETGHTTTALISQRIAQEATILLKQTNWTVSEIADSLGFADVAHFCNFYKRQTGTSPGVVRA